MKVLQIDVSVNIGSTGRIAEEIGLKILEAGGESSIAYGRHGRSSNSNTIKIGNHFDQAYHLLQTRIFDRHGFYSKTATRKLIKRVREINPDIIHLHQLHGYYINLKILFDFLKEYNKPVVWTFHDCWQFTGHCCYFTKVDCLKWKSICRECPLISTYPKSWLTDNSEKNYIAKKKLFNSLGNLTIVPVSYWLEGVVKESFFAGNKINVISNGVDVKIFKPGDQSMLRRKYNLSNKKILLGVASTWSAHKGLADFIKISGMIDANTRIVLIGLNKRQMGNLPENIIAIERTENIMQLAEYYSLADVFLNPSSSESFGLVTVEAMACGTPVVVYNSTASPELVSHGSTGYIVEKGDANSMFEAAMTIINKGKDQYSSTCVERVRNNYNKDIQFMKYIDLYNNLLKE